MIIFGWGHGTTKDYGPTLPMQCPHCNNNVYWHYVHARVWFTLFFIPVIPYENRHLLLCSICTAGVDLAKEQAEHARHMSETTKLFINNQLPEDQYRDIVERTPLMR